MLTAKQIVDRNIVFLSDENKKKYNIKLECAQMGIDLHMISCAKLKDADFGRIFADDMIDPATGKTKKTVICKTDPVILSKDDEGQNWILEPGVYEIGFAEGCNFGGKEAGKIVHRSSVYRNGSEINSPLWDPGFHTNEMGTFLTVKHTIKIYLGARVGQMLVWESSEEAEKYEGQYQGTGVLNGQH